MDISKKWKIMFTQKPVHKYLQQLYYNQKPENNSDVLQWVHS